MNVACGGHEHKLEGMHGAPVGDMHDEHEADSRALAGWGGGCGVATGTAWNEPSEHHERRKLLFASPIVGCCRST